MSPTAGRDFIDADHAVPMLAVRTHGYVTIEELRMAGLTKAQIQTKVRRGALVNVRRGLYAVGYEQATDEGRWARAVRGCGTGAALDGWSAAHAWGFATSSPARPEVVAPARRRAIAGASLRIDGRMTSEWVYTHRHIPILTPTRTIARIAAVARPERVVKVMREAAYRGMLDVDSLHDVVERETGTRGIRKLASALALRATGSAGARSALELRVIDRMARTWPDAPSYNVRVSVGSTRIEVDLLWPDLMICVEIDGPHHDEPDVRRDDLARDAALRAHGWTPFRVHWAAFAADPDAAVAPILDAIRAAHGSRTDR